MVRIKERYLLVNILYPSDLGSRPDLPDVVVVNQPTTDQLTPVVLLRGIRSEVANLFGDYGSGAIEGGSLSGEFTPTRSYFINKKRGTHQLTQMVLVKYLSQATSTFILRTSRSSYRFVWTALTFMNSVPVKNGKPCIFRVVRVSGTMRKAEEEAVRRARDLIFAAQNRQGEKSVDPLSNIFGASSNRSSRKVSRVGPLEVEEGDSDIEMGEVSEG
ncbi:Rpp14 family protein [Biscogniauxia marginata]|nr:Rpp14 family protein [Biscogniauxia marginata]